MNFVDENVVLMPSERQKLILRITLFCIYSSLKNNIYVQKVNENYAFEWRTRGSFMHNFCSVAGSRIFRPSGSSKSKIKVQQNLIFFNISQIQSGSEYWKPDPRSGSAPLHNCPNPQHCYFAYLCVNVTIKNELWKCQA